MKFLVILFTFFLLSCSQKVQVVNFQGEDYKAQVSEDTLVTIKTENGEITIDRRKRSTIEDIIKLYGLKMIDSKN